MRAWLFICFLLAPVAAPGHAQQPGQASPPPPSTTGEAGLVEGDVYLRMQNGDVRRMASGQVYLVPDSVLTALAPLCAVRESRRTQYVRLRRPVRLAYDSARSARGGMRSALLDRADSAAAAAAAALVPARQAEADIVARLSAQRAAQRAEAHYVFDAVAPGDYALYSDANLPNSLFGLPYLWFVPIRVTPGRQTRDLDNTNMAPVLFDRASAAAWAACLTPRRPQTVPDSVGAIKAVEERPVLINREEVQRELRRRYPSVLRGSGGSVIVRMRILEDGSVDVETVEALNLSVRLEALENSTIEKVRRETESAAEMVAERMRFSPATIDGRAVKVWVTQPLTFQSSR